MSQRMPPFVDVAERQFSIRIQKKNLFTLGALGLLLRKTKLPD